ncbi:MAG: DinB family protein [Candidatus Eisenbacteria bacterium]
MRNVYRKGAVGALMDEYERSAGEMRRLIERVSQDDFEKVVDPETTDAECRSIQTVMSHVVNSGYGYADHIRDFLSMPSDRPPRTLLSHRECPERLDQMLAYTADTLEGRWGMTDEEIGAVVILSRWGVTYNLEQLLEHAIVHILRHRRQTEKFMKPDLT